MTERKPTFCRRARAPGTISSPKTRHCSSWLTSPLGKSWMNILSLRGLGWSLLMDLPRSQQSQSSYRRLQSLSSSASSGSHWESERSKTLRYILGGKSFSLSHHNVPHHQLTFASDCNPTWRWDAPCWACRPWGRWWRLPPPSRGGCRCAWWSTWRWLRWGATAIMRLMKVKIAISVKGDWDCCKFERWCA